MKNSYIKERDQIVVACPVKNDNEYLVEFAEHYLKLGFDKIYFLDNNDDDAINPSDVLTDFLNNGSVAIIDFRNRDFEDTIIKFSFFFNYQFKWALFVDEDEFLELKMHTSIREFLSSFNADVTKIIFNIVHHGDNDQIFQEPGKVQERFCKPIPLELSVQKLEGKVFINSYIKSLLKKRDFNLDIRIYSHSLIDNTPVYNADGIIVELASCCNRVNNKDITYNTAYIRHYCTKSLEEFVKTKMKRAQSNCSEYQHRFGIYNYYFFVNTITQEKKDMVTYFCDKYNVRNR